MLLERLTGKEVRTAVTDLAIRPAGLRDTYWPATGDTSIRGPHAHNYRLDPANQLIDATAFEPSVAGASGAIISTPSDLNRFWQELLNGHLLPSRMLAEMTTTVPAPAGGPGAGYGLGIERIPLSCGGDFWGHDGDLLGVANISGRSTSGREATIYMTAQTGSEATTQLSHTLDTALCGQEVK
jgi:D-alanyl-D-alanine carboxypeptidase